MSATADGTGRKESEMSRIHPREESETDTERERRLIRVMSSDSGRVEAFRLLAEQVALEDMLWSAYSGYVVAHCHRLGDMWVLDEMAEELFTLAVNWEIHKTF